MSSWIWYPTFQVWRPDLPESNDGKPLATLISDLSPTNFPIDRLSAGDTNNYVRLLNIFYRPEYVALMLLFYNISKPIFKVIQKSCFPNPDESKVLIGFIAIHNLALAIFSGIVAYNSWPIIIEHYWQHGLFDMYCDPNGTLWTDSGFGPWATIFYISKYYEFIDTWILVLKGKRPSFLQIYHHTGIAFCMWVGTLSQSSWLMYVVLLNSIIHTLMYIYFFIKTINPKYQIKAAKYLTKAQIGQFFTGIICSAGVLWFGDECDTQASRFGLACLQVYGYGLIALFMSFAKKKYNKTK